MLRSELKTLKTRTKRTEYIPQTNNTETLK